MVGGVKHRLPEAVVAVDNASRATEGVGEATDLVSGAALDEEAAPGMSDVEGEGLAHAIVEETDGRLIYELGNRQWDIPELRELLEDILPQHTSFRDFRVTHDFETIGKREMLLNAREVHQEAGDERLILLAIEESAEDDEADR